MAAVVMQEGLAHVCLVLSTMTLVRAKIDQAIPRKRHGNIGNHEKVFVLTMAACEYVILKVVTIKVLKLCKNLNFESV